MRGVCRKLLVSVALFSFASLPVISQEQHVTGTTVRHREPVTPEVRDRELEEAAEKYRQDAPVPRFAFYDVAFPKDREEYEALNKHALVLIVVVAQDGRELPLKRVYLRQDGRDNELSRFGPTFASETAPDSLTRKVLGKHREDSYYLIPVQTFFEKGQLLLDFSRNRQEFLLTEFPDEIDEEYIMSDKNRQPRKGVVPDTKAVFRLLAREFLGVEAELREEPKPQ